MTTSNSRPRYCPTWHILDNDGKVINAVGEAQLKTAGVIVTPDLPATRQYEIIGLMDVGETVLCRVIGRNYSVRDYTHLDCRIIRVS